MSATFEAALDDVFLGLYMRLPNEQGEAEFVRVTEHNTLRHELKQAIRQALERAKPIIKFQNADVAVDTYRMNAFTEMGLLEDKHD